MSKIYIIGGKSELIDAIKTNKFKVTLSFIKKYHKYYPYLSFFPTVLADMIFDYINDVFEIKCEIHCPDLLYVDVYTKIQLNYETIFFDFYFCPISYQEYQNCEINRLHRANNKFEKYTTICYMCFINYFLKTYCKTNKLIPIKHEYTSYCIQIHKYKEIIKRVNINHTKHEIIIMMMMWQFVSKKLKNNHD